MTAIKNKIYELKRELNKNDLLVSEMVEKEIILRKSASFLFEGDFANNIDHRTLSKIPIMSRFKLVPGVYGMRLPTGSNSNLLFATEFVSSNELPIHIHPDLLEEIHVYKGMVKDKLTGEVTKKYLKTESGIARNIEADIGTKIYVLLKLNKKNI